MGGKAVRMEVLVMRNEYRRGGGERLGSTSEQKGHGEKKLGSGYHKGGRMQALEGKDSNDERF